MIIYLCSQVIKSEGTACVKSDPTVKFFSRYRFNLFTTTRLIFLDNQVSVRSSTKISDFRNAQILEKNFGKPQNRKTFSYLSNF